MREAPPGVGPCCPNPIGQAAAAVPAVRAGGSAVPWRVMSSCWLVCRGARHWIPGPGGYEDPGFLPPLPRLVSGGHGESANSGRRRLRCSRCLLLCRWRGWVVLAPCSPCMAVIASPSAAARGHEMRQWSTRMIGPSAPMWASADLRSALQPLVAQVLADWRVEGRVLWRCGCCCWAPRPREKIFSVARR